MTRKNSSNKALALISSSTVVSQVATLLRAFIIMRTIGVENYGIAVPMLLLIEFLNRLLELNPAAVIVQDEKGATKKFRHAFQFMSLIRGVLFALIIVLLAVPLAVFNDLDSREYVMGFMFVGLVPLIRGCSHVDIFRQMRRRRFGNVALSQTSTPVATTVMVAMLCLFMNSFWVPLIARVIDAVNGLIMSFVVAERRWMIRFDGESMVRIIRFMLPLIVGGMVVFISNRGSQQLLSASDSLFGFEIPKAVVGTLAAAVLIAMIPGSIGASVIQQVFAPRTAEIGRRGGNVARLFEQVQALGFTLGAAALIMLQAGSVIVPVLLTERFEGTAPFLVALSVFGALRLSSTSAKTIALGLGKSKILMYGNFWSVLGIVCSIWVVYNQRSLVEIGYCMGIGEALSYIARGIMVRRLVPSISLNALFVKPALVLLCALAIGTVQRYTIDGMSLPLALPLMFAWVVAGSALLSLFWAPVRSIVSQRLAD
ncbi:MAG: hypothetical protein CMJ33_09925 [Phycisphaerae bacterium]|nr:hypothetical protein [Phycisphaerae bacterium]|tara:strand:- start:81 stop:1532 length:1452 start_codon:yes stop_codon:yes gene_type:complete